MTLLRFSHTPLLFSRDGNIATLLENMRIVLDTDQGKYLLTIRKGFRWNGNSGAFPCRFHKTNTKYNVIILVHDALYHRIGMSKADADDILRGGLRIAGYGRVMAGTIHLAVTWFGRCAYNEDDEMTLSNLKYLKLEML